MTIMAQVDKSSLNITQMHGTFSLDFPSRLLVQLSWDELATVECT
jgi:hypothetical protein